MYWARQGGGSGPIVLVPGGLFWTRRRASVDFRWVVPDTHDYFLRRPKAGRLRPSSKSVPLSRSGPCGSVALVFQRLQQNPHHIWCCARSGWWPWCSKQLHQNSYSGRLVFSLLRRWGGVPKVGVVFQTIVTESSLCILLIVQDVFYNAMITDWSSNLQNPSTK